MKKRQSKLNEFFNSENSGESDEFQDDELGEDEDAQESDLEKGSRKLPLKWTRVFKVSRDPFQELEIHNLQEDEQNFIDQAQDQEQPENTEWKALFNPDDFKGRYDELICKDYDLSYEQVLQYAQDVTQIRSEFGQKAEQVRVEDNESEFDSNQRKIRAPSDLKRKKYVDIDSLLDPEEQKEPVLKYHASKQKARTGKDLSALEKTNIAHDALVNLKSNEEISALHNVKKTYVITLVHKIKQNHEYLKEQQTKLNEKQEQIDLICKVVQDLKNAGKHVWRSSMIQQIMAEEHEMSVSLSQIRHVLNKTLNMKFKQIKGSPFLGNAQRCLVMRQLYAKQMIAILQSGKTIYNFDESFINETFFTRRKWCDKGETNSIPVRAVSPRISMFLVVDSDGNAYLSLSQSNTKSSKVILFFDYFFELLDIQKPGWKENSVILMDGASYHKSPETLEYFKQQNVAVFISAPYSFDAAVCELWFSYFKSQDLNPENQKTGKMNLVSERVQQMNRSSNVRFWRQSSLSLFKYLNYQKL